MNIYVYVLYTYITIYMQESINETKKIKFRLDQIYASYQSRKWIIYDKFVEYMDRIRSFCCLADLDLDPNLADLVHLLPIYRLSGN